MSGKVNSIPVNVFSKCLLYEFAYFSLVLIFTYLLTYLKTQMCYYKANKQHIHFSERKSI